MQKTFQILILTLAVLLFVAGCSNQDPAPLGEGELLASLIPPTIAATGTTGHIMKERPLLSIIPVVKGACRTILNAGQATVAFVIDLKERHAMPPFSP